jgi:hypothetical protein
MEFPKNLNKYLLVRLHQSVYLKTTVVIVGAGGNLNSAQDDDKFRTHSEKAHFSQTFVTVNNMNCQTPLR